MHQNNPQCLWYFHFPRSHYQRFWFHRSALWSNLHFLISTRIDADEGGLWAPVGWGEYIPCYSPSAETLLRVSSRMKAGAVSLVTKLHLLRENTGRTHLPRHLNCHPWMSCGKTRPGPFQFYILLKNKQRRALAHEIVTPEWTCLCLDNNSEVEIKSCGLGSSLCFVRRRISMDPKWGASVRSRFLSKCDYQEPFTP